MRKYTLVFSIVVHAAIVVVAFVVPIVATDILPRPPRMMRVVLGQPALPPPPPVRRIETVPRASVDAAPLVEPPTIAPEPPTDPLTTLAVDDSVGLVTGVAGSLGAMAIGGPGDPLPPPAQPASPLRVGGAIRPPERTRYVAPVYPEIARSARVSGVVILEAVIGEDGSVRDVRVLRSIALLDRSAVEAVTQWRFSPTLLNGQAIPVVMTVTVNFALN